MTPALACTPAGHTQYGHLFETPVRPRAFLALGWAGMSTRAGSPPQLRGAAPRGTAGHGASLLQAVSVPSEVPQPFSTTRFSLALPVLEHYDQ